MRAPLAREHLKCAPREPLHVAVCSCSLSLLRASGSLSQHVVHCPWSFRREVVGDFDPDVDCLLLGDIDAQVQRLAELCGWEGELEAVLSSLRQG